MSEADAIDRTLQGPGTVDSLSRDLNSLGVTEGMIVIVHSSLSSIGWVCGGSVGVVLALEQTLGIDGTLIMPTHSGDLSDPAKWENPPVPQAWWQSIRDNMPAYDCLLYTSDAADDLLCVDLGGRRIIKKKRINTKDSKN